MAPAAARAFKKFPSHVQERIGSGLAAVAEEAAAGRGFGGRKVEEIRGAKDSFLRMRAGDYRVMFDLVDEEDVVLVLGVVHRRDLERLVRNR